MTKAILILVVVLAGGIALGLYRTVEPADEPVPTGLRADPEAVYASCPPGAIRATASFVIRNPGRSPVTVHHVEWGCSCTDGTDLRGSTIPPGGSVDMTVRINPPETGSRKVSIKVVHDSSPIPLVLVVEAAGSQTPPYVTEVSPKRLAFFQINENRAPQELAVSTMEPADQPAWITGFRSEFTEAAVVIRSIDETAMGVIVKRVYHCEFRWQRVPPGKEFYGKIQANIRHDPLGLGATTVDVGEVSGTQ